MPTQVFKDPVIYNKRPIANDVFSRKVVAYDPAGAGWILTPDLSGNITTEPNPSLYRDFTTYKTLNHGEGPDINFVRNSSATVFTSTGVLTSVANNVPRFDHDNFRTNLVTWSTFSSAGSTRWSNAFPTFATVITGIDAPDGTTTAVRLSSNNQGIALLRVGFPTFTIATSGTPYNVSFWCRKISGTGTPGIDLNDGAPVGNYDSQLATNTWNRVSLSGIPLSGSKSFVDVFSNLNSNLVLDFWGLQLETGLSATPYIPTAGSTVTVGDSKGLLIEEARTNLLLQSQALATTWGTAGSPTRTNNAATAPDGTTTATLFERTTTAASYVAQAISKATSAITYTFTTYAKANTGRYFAFQFTCANGTGGTGQATFDLLNGSISGPAFGTGAGVGTTSATISNAGNGWYRCSLTTTSDNGDGIISYLSFSSISNAGVLTVDSSSTSSGFLWGAQVEVGTFATSYIPTTTATVTRSADVAQITGSSFNSFYNQSAGTLFATVNSFASGSNTNQAYFEYGSSISGDFNNNRIGVYRNYSTNSVFTRVINAGVSSNISTSSTVAANTPGKVALAYSTSSSNVAVNGVLGTARSVTLPTPDTYVIYGVNGPINGWLSSIAYYPSRLTDYWLQRLTQ